MKIRFEEPDHEFVKVRTNRGLQLVQLERIHKAPSNAIYFTIFATIGLLAILYFAL